MNLDGFRILDLTQLLPGPYATQLLADLGADVVKIEPPEGDPLRSFPLLTPDDRIFRGINRGKRSVVLDLKSDEGQRALETLAVDADAVIEGFRPGVAARLGADYETLQANNADLVYCSVSGYGQTGPYSDRPGHDLTFSGVSGLLDLTRRSRDDPPTIPGFSVGDVSSGLFAAFAVVTGLLTREHTGEGTYVDVSMLDVLVSLSQSSAPSALTGSEPEPPTPFTGAYPCYDVYETADGRYVTLAALEAPFWRRFCERVDRPDLLDAHCSNDPSVRATLREELVDLFATRTRAEWIDACAGEETTVAPVNTLTEALDDPHVRQREMVAGDRLGFPARTEPPTEPETTAPPERGEHTRAILADAGCDPELIEAVTGD